MSRNSTIPPPRPEAEDRMGPPEDHLGCRFDVVDKHNRDHHWPMNMLL